MAIKKPSRKKSLLSVVLIIIALLLVAGGVVLYLNKDSNLNPFRSVEPGSAEENEQLILLVGKLIILPDEKPEIATVSDINQLKNQSIFKSAQNGDKVLIFPKAKRAIVFRPAENIIVEVGDLVISQQASPSAKLNDEEVKKASVMVLNATTTAGYAGRIGDELTSKFSNLEVIDTGNAVGDYNSVLVVDVTGKNKDSAQAIADELNGKVGDLPDGEEKPDSDILVILGQ